MFKKMEFCHRPIDGLFTLPRVLNKARVRLIFKTNVLGQKYGRTRFFGCWEMRPVVGTCALLGPGIVDLCLFSPRGGVEGGGFLSMQPILVAVFFTSC